MAVRIISVGKLSISFLQEAEAEYLKRLKPHLKLGVLELSNSRSSDPTAGMQDEGRRILENVKPREQLIALDEQGEGLTSAEFAKVFERLLTMGDISFVIGGAFGLSREVKQRATRCIALSPMTFTYQFARVILIEQLYRATCINRGVDYHK